MKKFLTFILSLLSSLFWFVLMLSFSGAEMTFLTLLCAIVHEVGHMLVLLFLNKDFSFPKAVTSGFRIKTNSELSYRDEILVALGGPAINLVLFLSLISFMPTLAVINLVTAISNLLPLKDFDGYKIIYDLISLFIGCQASERVMPHITVAVSAVMVFLSLFMIMASNGGYWIFFIFFIVLIKQILFLQKHSFFEH